MAKPIAQITELFFDRDRVVRSMDRATRKALSKFGAFVRTRARSSIRSRKGTSQPGKPPRSHTGLLKRFLFFSYEPSVANVVIGPAKLNTGTKAPELLEHGGTDSRGRTYAARPFMGPAFAREVPNAPELFENAME